MGVLIGNFYDHTFLSTFLPGIRNYDIFSGQAMIFLYIWVILHIDPVAQSVFIILLKKSYTFSNTQTKRHTLCEDILEFFFYHFLKWN